MHASKGLPSSSVTAPELKPKVLSHSEGCLEQMISIQTSGNQSAPVTLCFCLESRRKRKTMNPIVKNAATAGGVCIDYLGKSEREIGDQKSAALLQIGKFNYLHRESSRLLKEAVNTLNCPNDHLFRHFRV